MFNVHPILRKRILYALAFIYIIFPGVILSFNVGDYSSGYIEATDPFWAIVLLAVPFCIGYLIGKEDTK